ncbi:hypothetical protein CH253_18305 [Rhodococcus sp. 06-156-3C]|uniref:hypothetical protein n=1 Tax=Nocardiaceae TaxID=85025 RepID=UPI00068F4FBD|nr:MULTISPECIES: hypothetical protein [Rhodococcus]OZD13020.1 hypothetical protein CH248_27505 [Rhodococcus sp. 06-156-4a]OZD17889.1 hypothetical protein CH253_18305 [Rhodococcus sp. 06-156-3C]OZD20614.1 hypothetical protein CH280_03460 [Rhodococcus sp. 06-156-4C]OZD30667.1 hypothetical protein CH247_15265 [Rhodococcus sp. 06-156-3b]OZD32559.1 hypothetical protein CH284_19990 [Rhodococcus sp. 06-156-3]
MSTPPTNRDRTDTRSLLRQRVRRIAGVLAITASLILFTGGIAAAQSTNPFNDVTPDLGLLGPALNATWKRVLGAAWGGCFALTSFNVLTSFLKFRKARGRNMPSDLSDATDDLRWALLALGGTAVVSLIIGAALLLVQPAAA